MLQESQYLFKCSGKQYMYMHQAVCNNKLKHKCTLTSLDPRLLYVDLIQAKGYLSFRDTWLDSYSSLIVTCLLYLAACSVAGYLTYYAVLGSFQHILLSLLYSVHCICAVL